ncbi:4657_t:CDS:2 [Gigaspora margarita]|uniref:4657_t:CDS:1 n=1 Tax=Gigaspora margarita TaxID=4874 RepID=A0ABM8W7I0_GIGMA|nr:4657_t:CDS:2 [Gigaspora margarita]
MGISPIYNRIIIDLSHNDDKKNEAFLNATLPFEQFIFINYDDSDDNSNDSLSLRSTSNSSSSKLRTKRIIGPKFLGGEGVAVYINGTPEIRCSAGFSAFDTVTRLGYLFTSARCLRPSIDIQEIYQATWNSPIPLQESFGFLREYRLTDVDNALIEKFDNDYRLSPCIRNLLYVEENLFPFLLIDGFNFNRLLPAGHALCISGYDSHFICGKVTSSSSESSLPSLRPGRTVDVFYNMIKVSIDGLMFDRDIGGTVFSIQYVENEVYIIVEGILTAARYVEQNGTTTAIIQPIRRIREIRLAELSAKSSD